MVQASRLNTKVLAAIAAVLVLAVLAAALLLRSPAPKPVVATSFLELNATPFAEVVSATPAGKPALKLPDGDHITPMRLDGVPQGSYAVVFKGTDGAVQSANCTVSDDNHLCTAQLAPLTDADISAIVAGGQP